MLTAFFFTPSCSDKNLIRHWLALPFYGGAETFIFNISSSSPQIRVGPLLLGTTFATKTAPSLRSSIFRLLIPTFIPRTSD
jgi:hypothetical protein